MKEEDMEFTLALRLFKNGDTLNTFEKVKIEDIVKNIESAKRTDLALLDGHLKKIREQKVGEKQKYILYKFGKPPVFFYLFVTRTK